MIGIREYVMLTKLVLDQERVQGFGMGIFDTGLHDGVVLDNDRGAKRERVVP